MNLAHLGGFEEVSPTCPGIATPAYPSKAYLARHYLTRCVAARRKSLVLFIQEMPTDRGTKENKQTNRELCVLVFTVLLIDYCCKVALKV